MSLPVADPNQLIQRQSRILILDYDVTRFHSFDLFRYLCLDKSFFMKMDPVYVEMFRGHKPIAEQVDFYRSTCSSLNPFDNFPVYKDQVQPNQLDQYMNSMFKNERAAIMETDLSTALYTVLCSTSVTGFWVHYQNDPHKAGFADAVGLQSDVVDEMFRPKEIAKYIIKNAINSLIVSSVEFAILISSALIKEEYHTPMTLMICNYNYNYEPFEYKGNQFKQIKHVQTLLNLEDGYQYEIGMIDPFTGLTRNRLLVGEES